MTVLSNIEFGTLASDKLGAVLQNFSKTNRDCLQTLAIPTRKTESWKYSAKHLKLANAYPPLSSDTPILEGQHALENLYALDCYTLVISNGQLQEHSIDHPGLSIKLFSELNEKEAQHVTEGAIAQSEQLEFAVANAAYLQDGVYLNISQHIDIDKPLKIIFQQDGEGASFPRLFLNIESGATLTLIEEICTHANEDAKALLNSICDINIGANAKVKYLRMNLDQGTSKLIGATGINLHRDACFESHCLAFGSALARHDLIVRMLEPGAECDLKCVCITRDKQHFDMHTNVEHIAPNCTSNETYRCIADDKSHIVFNGRIHIHRNAQKTLGSLSNKNLLLSSDAEIDSKPELEIYADDVKCAHGTTIGQLDKTELYYLKTRGISHDQAKLMLTLGFVLEVVRTAPIEEIAQFWEQRLTDTLRIQ